MNVSVSDAKAQLTDLIRRAERGDEVILTRRGLPAVKLVPVTPPPIDDDERWKLLKELQGSAKGDPAWEGVTAATAADFLYDDKGLPV